MSRFINSFLVLILLAGALFLLATPQGDQPELSGKPRIVDGDTIAFGAHNVRLWGIDAPEFDQFCRDEVGEAWACGRVATQMLRDWSDLGPWTCDNLGLDKYRRILGRCTITPDDTAQLAFDPGGRLVAEGFALGDRAYDAEERLARVAKQGMHSGEYIHPADWRDGKRFDAESGQADGVLAWIWSIVTNWFS